MTINFDDSRIPWFQSLQTRPALIRSRKSWKRGNIERPRKLLFERTRSRASRFEFISLGKLRRKRKKLPRVDRVLGCVPLGLVESHKGDKVHYIQKEFDFEPNPWRSAWCEWLVDLISIWSRIRVVWKLLEGIHKLFHNLIRYVGKIQQYSESDRTD